MKEALLMCLIIFSTFIIGCTTEVTTEDCQDIVCTTDTGESEVIEGVEEVEMVNGLIIYTIDAGAKPVYILVDDTFADIINCGNIAHGPATVDKIIDIRQKNDNVRLGSLIITDTSPDAIGGCKNILSELPTLDATYIYGEEVSTDDYQAILDWTPSKELTEYNTGEFEYGYGNNTIDFSRLDSDIVETDGITYNNVG